MPKRNQSPTQLANLRRINTEQAREMGKKGGVASAKARAEKRNLQQVVQAALDTKIVNSKGEEVTVKDAIVLAQVKKALNGDSKAFNNLGEYSGEKPAEKQQVELSEPRQFVFVVKK